MQHVKFLIISLLCIPLISTAYAHTVDSAGDYRLEIGWINEPAVSGETNGIELYISKLDPTKEFDEQEFDMKKGIADLRKDFRMELVYKEEKIFLNVLQDHDVPGKYFGLVNPTIDGYYQVNIIGKIGDTTVSKSMHPPKVENREQIDFPVRQNEKILSQHETIQSELDTIKSRLNSIEENNSIQNYDLGIVGIMTGIIGIAIASAAIIKNRR
ncbi:hypothetical protein C6988_02655 [Nitrosopumilus sp. b1]|uniref:hypothetical protein n=1 Tax=Nitrosopumilus sp. b1 TaxID=2109907 RepID=UPI0015F45A19|nr:hypothetical protein [Nitrosopumilus sp. b1]KAF6243555.1 hypothetical protein C6988_02655 [Nitrosopumilus sp. b1]